MVNQVAGLLQPNSRSMLATFSPSEQRPLPVATRSTATDRSEVNISSVPHSVALFNRSCPFLQSLSLPAFAILWTAASVRITLRSPSLPWMILISVAEP